MSFVANGSRELAASLETLSFSLRTETVPDRDE
jgi:hypothetical protein